LIIVYEDAEDIAADSAQLALVKAVKDEIDLGYLKDDIPTLMR